MILTLKRLYPIVKLPFGKQVWVEQSQLNLPKGGKKLDYGFKFFASFFFVSGVLSYIYLQADQNPDSIYGRFFKTYVTDNLKQLEGAEGTMAPIAKP